MKGKKKTLSPTQEKELLTVLKVRFEKNMKRHKGIEWAKVEAKLKANPGKLWSLDDMETSGGEPDVVGHDKKSGEYIFYDCSAESPKDRRSICYDRKALDSRKEHKPKNSAMDMAAEMGIAILTEEQYRELQELGEFDTKTSSWVRRQIISGNSAARFFAIAGTTMSSCITTARNLIMRPGGFVAH